MEINLEKYISEYPFLQYLKEDKSRYKHAKDCGYKDDDDLFLIGDSGGFLLNIQPGDKFVNTYLFTEMADTYRKNKQYTTFREDSIPHRQLRAREEYRREHGLSAPCLLRNGKIQEVRITGGHYNFLNYTMIEQLDEASVNYTDKSSTGKKKYDFSKFIDAQFWTWHIMEFAVRNGFHLIIDKTRRGGFSYIMASDSANDINLHPRKINIHVAADKNYLTKKGGLTDFTLNNLRFYETKTFFKRGILSTDKENFTLGFKLPNGITSPKSWNSALISVSAMNNPDCAIGKDALKVKTEEVSTMDNFDAFMDVTEPAMRTGAYVTGNLFAWGTATAKSDMQTFSQNFYNPEAYHFMPFENVWDKDCRHEVCGYFKPYCWGLQGQVGDRFAMDKDGNSDVELGLTIAFNEREIKRKKSKTFADYINYLGQYANMPSESFSCATENIFSSEELLEWEERLRTDNAFNFYTDGMLFEHENKVIFKSNARIEAEGGKHNIDFFDWIRGVPIKSNENHHGCIRIWFHPQNFPYNDKDGNSKLGPPPGLYSISYDPVGVNKEKNAITNKHSHNSIKVWMNPTSYNGFRTALVAAYYGRPEELEEADKICYLLARYYNCIGTVGVEVNRGETVTNFKKWKALKYLMKDPVQLWDTSMKGAVSTTYGVNMGGDSGQGTTKKLEGLRLLKEMLYSEIGKDELGRPKRLFHYIYDYQSILELKMWSNTGNYDRVSEMIIRALQWKLSDVQAAKELAHRKQIIVDRKNIMKRAWF